MTRIILPAGVPIEASGWLLAPVLAELDTGLFNHGSSGGYQDVRPDRYPMVQLMTVVQPYLARCVMKEHRECCGTRGAGYIIMYRGDAYRVEVNVRGKGQHFCPTMKLKPNAIRRLGAGLTLLSMAEIGSLAMPTVQINKSAEPEAANDWLRRCR